MGIGKSDFLIPLTGLDECYRSYCRLGLPLFLLLLLFLFLSFSVFNLSLFVIDSQGQNAFLSLDSCFCRERQHFEGSKWRRARWLIDRSFSFFAPFDFEWTKRNVESRGLIKVSATMVEVSLHSPLVRIVLTVWGGEGRERVISIRQSMSEFDFAAFFFSLIFNSRGREWG